MQQFKVEILDNINPKDYFPDAKHIIVYAFTIGKFHYFRFDDPFNTPYMRALCAQVYYKEVELNVGRDFMIAHTTAIKNILNNSEKIDLFAINELNELLIKRMSLPKEPELMYKLASVTFFDQFEPPYNYEFNYNAKKIANWKKYTGLEDFFLSKPIKELIPYLQHVGSNLETFSKMLQERNLLEWDRVSAHLSKEEKEKMTIK